MTEDEQRLVIEKAEQTICCGERCLKVRADGGCAKDAWRDEARAALAPMFAKIAALEAENAALRSMLGGATEQIFDKYVSDIQAYEDRAIAAETENAELRAALAPFAHRTKSIEQFIEDRARDGGSTIMPMNDLRVADFCRASAALANKDDAK